MMPLGTRVVEPRETLEDRIAARLNEAADVADRANLDPGPDVTCGLAVAVGEAGEALLVLSVEDVARIAAQEALAWF